MIKASSHSRADELLSSWYSMTLQSGRILIHQSRNDMFKYLKNSRRKCYLQDEISSLNSYKANIPLRSLATLKGPFKNPYA